MRTNVIPETEQQAPCLEPLDAANLIAEPIVLGRFPFTIGRNATCDHQIASSRISREHVRIFKDAKGYRIKDLGSTNGTSVNGQKVGESRLAQGDILAIADLQFSFCLPQHEDRTAGATMVLSDDPDRGELVSDSGVVPMIATIRRLQESVLCRALPIRYEAIFSFTQHKVVGFEAHLSGLWNTAGDCQGVLSVESRLVERARLLYRVLAAEQTASAPEAGLLLLTLRHEEVSADHLPETLSRFVQHAENRQLALGAPHAAAVDTPYFQSFVARIHSLGLQTALTGFAGGAKQLTELAKMEPRLVQLAPAMVRGLDRSTQRQRQLKELAVAAADLNAGLIAAGLHTQNEADVCRDLGCPLGQGDFFPQSPSLCPALEGLFA
jgi:EAL domain-containing protein (putative c-di-GMP-specific phosphodiesterase class I)